MTQCRNLLQMAGEPYPRTCAVCGLGPCSKFRKRVPWGSESNIATVEQALERLAEIKREQAAKEITA